MCSGSLDQLLGVLLYYSDNAVLNNYAMMHGMIQPVLRDPGVSINF